MPKYVITSANDEFFLPDDSHYYFSEMQGPTYLRWVDTTVSTWIPLSYTVKNYSVFNSVLQ